jgi:ADP-heptose:LPS heptosyltransferase
MSRAMLSCSHFVSNDSGPMHIASGVGVPVLAIYGPTDALSHLPMRSSTVALALEKPCSPCEVKDHRRFASGACACIAEITPNIVEARLLKMIECSSHEPAKHVVESAA